MEIEVEFLGHPLFRFSLALPLPLGEFISNAALDTELADDDPEELPYGFAGGSHGSDRNRR